MCASRPGRCCGPGRVRRVPTPQRPDRPNCVFDSTVRVARDSASSAPAPRCAAAMPYGPCSRATSLPASEEDRADAPPSSATTVRSSLLDELPSSSRRRPSACAAMPRSATSNIPLRDAQTLPPGATLALALPPPPHGPAPAPHERAPPRTATASPPGPQHTRPQGSTTAHRVGQHHDHDPRLLSP